MFNPKKDAIVQQEHEEDLMNERVVEEEPSGRPGNPPNKVGNDKTHPTKQVDNLADEARDEKISSVEQEKSLGERMNDLTDEVERVKIKQAGSLAGTAVETNK